MLSVTIMFIVLCFNVYGILKVGIENATILQWGITSIMLLFTADGIRRNFFK